MLNTIAVITTITAVFAFLNYKFIKLPTTIGIMTVSLLASLCLILLQYLGVSEVTDIANRLSKAVIFDEVVMNGMLSFLLFAGALHVNINDLSEQKWPIGLLSTFGVLITTFLFGYASYYVMQVIGLDIPLIYCCVFGSLISATDPIAVLGILKKAGAPKSLSIKIIGESLFNDGVAVVVFLVLSSIAIGTNEVTTTDIGILFAEEAIGGIVYGLLLGAVGYYMLKMVDNYQVEILLTLAIVIGGYALAQQIHVSGPIAIVVTGLMIGNHGRLLAMSDTTRKHLDQFWELLDEILNAFLFVLIGIEVLVIDFSPNVLIAGMVLIPILLLARFLSTSLLLGVLKFREEFTKHTELLLTWGGLRGAISVALALSLPPSETKDILVGITYIIVVFSILVQGLTIGKLIEFLLKKEDKT